MVFGLIPVAIILYFLFHHAQYFHVLHWLVGRV